MNTNHSRSAGLVDFHCHLDLYPDHTYLLEECEHQGIDTLAVTNAPSTFARNKALGAGLRYIHTALGLHPQLAHDRHGEIALFAEYLSHTRFVGEVGLDASGSYVHTLRIQREIFKEILELCSAVGNRVLSVHSRRTAREVIETVGDLLPPDKGRAVLHWFTGTQREARLALEAGLYFSVNNRMLDSPSGRKMIASISPDRVLTETDGPFVQIGGRPARPPDVRGSVEALALLWGVDTVKAKEIVYANALNLLS